MRILMAVHHFPPRYTGGAEWRAYRTARALMARGHDVRVLCIERVDQGNGEVVVQDDIFEGVSVRRLGFNLAASPDLFRWSYDNLWVGAQLRELIAAFKPDLLHLISGYLISGRALIEAETHNLPSVVTLTDFWFLCPRVSLLRSDGRISTLPLNPTACAQCLGEERRRYRWAGRGLPDLMRAYWRRQHAAIRQVEDRNTFLRRALNTAGAIISPSRFLRDLHVEAGIAPEKIRFSRQGRDFAGAVPDPAHKRRGPVLRLGYLGQIVELKGVHVLIDAVRRLPNANVSVTIYGDRERFPQYAERLRRQIGGDSRLWLAGAYQSQTDLAHLLADLDATVVPSLWYENSPNSILESFAYKTPVLASRLGGMAELVQHEQNGLLFEAGDAADLARQIQRLLDDPELLARLQSGIGPVRTVKEEMDELEAVYCGLVERRAATPPTVVEPAGRA